MITEEKRVALVRWSASLRGQPFSWGWNDCNMLVARAMDIILDTNDFTALLFAEYDDEATAVQFHASLHFTLEDVVAGAGAVAISPGFEQTGDILIQPDSCGQIQMQAGMVYVSDRAICAIPGKGILYVPPRMIQNYRLWRF
ncbi:MAG: hypothetical protein ABIL58_19940 [Pseudomonadota bacterium]